MSHSSNSYGGPPGLKLTRLYTEYATHLLHERTGKIAEAEPEPEITLLVRGEIETMVDVVHSAWNNPVGLDYSLEDVQKAIGKPVPKVTRTAPAVSRNEYLRQQFVGPYPQNQLGKSQLVDTATTFIDHDDRVVAWFLPGVFTPRRCDKVWAAVKKLSDEEDSILEADESSRHNMGNAFADPDRCRLRAGIADMSPSWYTLGSGPKKSKPVVSKSFGGEGGVELVRDLEETNALMGALLALVHPALFEMQMRVHEAMYGGEDTAKVPAEMKQAMENWSSPFTAFTLISNRETSYHRDTSGGRKLLDMLTAFGRYNFGRLEIPLLGARFAYNPGTAAIFPGYLFEHGAARTNGERICIASYIKPQVGVGVLEGYEEIPPPLQADLEDTHGWEYPLFKQEVFV